MSVIVAPLDIPGWTLATSGKVRDLYTPIDATQDIAGDSNKVLIVASDRVSAFDRVLCTPIPGKGQILTQLSLWWFDYLCRTVRLPHHVLGSTVADGVPAMVAGRAMLCRKLKMLPVECIARGYLTGSGLQEYRQHGTLGGHRAPEGLLEGSRLPEVFFTPSRKGKPGEPDENIDEKTLNGLVGADCAQWLREKTVEIYAAAAEVVPQSRVLLADMKVEFGVAENGELLLADEVLTPDASRYWDLDAWVPGRATEGFDKQYLRNWLSSASGATAFPPLPDHVVREMQRRYTAVYERLTGQAVKEL